METVYYAVTVLAGLGVAFGIGLAIASRVFAISVDPRVDEVTEALPGANCGACGFAGCAAYAEAVVLKGASPADCIPGGSDTIKAIAEIMGVEAVEKDPLVAVVHCGGREVDSKFNYAGIADCTAATLLQGGFKSCSHGCLGLGSCVKACPFDAIYIKDGLAEVDREKCVACGKCVDACPRMLIEIHPAKAMVQALCKSTEKGGVVRKACASGCIGCKKCEKICPAEAIPVNNFLAAVDDEKCIRCCKCIKECPTGVLARFRKKAKAKVAS